MSRYFAQYFNSDPMTELSEAQALADGDFVMLVEGTPRLYRCFRDGRVSRIIYPGWDEPTVPLEHLRTHYPGMPAQIFSPVVTRRANGMHRTILAPHWWHPLPPDEDATVVTWKTWYVDETGQLKKIFESTYDAEGYILREDYRGPDGELRTYSIYRYDHQGFLIDLVTHNPDGSVFNIEDA